LSWFVDAYPRIARWTASVNRLTGFDEALGRVQQLSKSPAALGVTPSPTSTLIVKDMQLSLPDLVTRAVRRRTAADRLCARLRLPTRLIVPGRGLHPETRSIEDGVVSPAR